MSLDLEHAKILDEFAVPEAFRAKLLDSACLKVWQFAEYVDDVKDSTSILSSLEPPIVDRMHIASVRRAYKAACARDAELPSRGRDYPNEDMDAPIESNRRRTLIEEHARHYRFQLQLSRQPSDTLLGRLDREKDRSTFTVINLAKVASVAAQSAHTKHIEVAPGISFNLGTHEPLEASGDSKAMGLAQWLLNLRILYNCYSIIGVRKVATSANSESMWCSWQVFSYFVDTLTDLATANIPGTKMRPTTGVLQLAELHLRTRVVELLRLGAEGGCLTFDDAFNKAFIEKQSLFHCALSPQTQVNNVQHQVQKRAADSRTSDRQARRKTDSQSAEPRPRPQYSKYTLDGAFICPDYYTRGCSLNKCWYKSLNAVHCCDVWGCYKEHLDGSTDPRQHLWNTRRFCLHVTT